MDQNMIWFNFLVSIWYLKVNENEKKILKCGLIYKLNWKVKWYTKGN